MPIVHAGMFTKILLTIGVFVAVLVLSSVVRVVLTKTLTSTSAQRPRFWATQVVHILTVALAIFGIVVVWAENADRLATIGGWFAAALVIALQRVVTAFAGYVIILRGNIFTVGDRITLGEVRGDVVALGFMQTTIMEMGQAYSEQSDKPSMWIHGRQYSGRIVRVTNDKIFDTPVYNYTHDFPYMWEEIVIPVRYADDYRIVERIMLDTALRHTTEIQQEASAALRSLTNRYFFSEPADHEPRVFMRLTDNWLELAMRFVCRPHGVRTLKDAMYRDIITALNAARIGIASGTYAVVELPPVKIENASELRA